MKVEILGSAGAVSTPRPGCTCRVCAEAREKGIPYSRTGPSTFVHGPDVLFDTPEDVKHQLNRARIGRIAACFYSHWHPDHVKGRRVWEELNYDWRNYPPQSERTPIFLPEQVAADFRVRLGSWDHLDFLAQIGVVDLVEVKDGDSVVVGDTTITPFRLAEEYVYAFLLEGGGKRLLVAPDELHGWEPPDWVRGVDIAVLPMGVCEFHPLSGVRLMPAEHPILAAEATFPETLAIVEKLRATRTILSHIEEIDGLTYDDLLDVGRRYGVEFAYDGMLVDA